MSATAISGLGRGIRLVFGRGTVDTDVPSEPDPTPPIDFVAYAEDCVVSGWLDLDGGRLADMLNDHDEYELVDVRIERLSDGSVLEEREIVVARDELLAVQASGPRGDKARRTRTVTHRLLMRLGPFEVVGSFHTAPGHDALAVLRRHRPIVALTDAEITQVDGSRRISGRIPVLLVNRECVDWVDVVPDVPGVVMPEHISEPKKGPLVRDYTPALYS